MSSKRSTSHGLLEGVHCLDMFLCLERGLCVCKQVVIMYWCFPIEQMAQETCEWLL
jgi:hypothetical protein